MARLLILSLGLSISFVACTPDYPNCKNDEHCSVKGEYCVNGLCQQCRTNENCGDCQQCAAGRCQVISGCCQDDNGCAVGQKCRSGQCGPECMDDSECGGENYCAEGRCVRKLECNSASDCAGGKVCTEGRCVEDPSAKQCSLENVLFGFDSAELNAQARSVLDANAQCLSARGVKTLVVEGHCDDRGTEEYNLALGERRARSAMAYLKRLGVSGMKVVSYGENRPAADGRGESSHAQNRRAQLTP